LTAKKGSLTSQLTLVLSSWRRRLDMRNSHLSVKLFDQTGKKLVYLTPKEARDLIGEDKADPVLPNNLQRGAALQPLASSYTDPLRTCEHTAKMKLPYYGVCQVCGFDRIVERAHIVPEAVGGPATRDNLLDLCPNHHALFDRNMLFWEEMEKIWPYVQRGLLRAKSDPRAQEWYNAVSTKYCGRFDISVE